MVMSNGTKMAAEKITGNTEKSVVVVSEISNNLPDVMMILNMVTAKKITPPERKTMILMRNFLMIMIFSSSGTFPEKRN